MAFGMMVQDSAEVFVIFSVRDDFINDDKKYITEFGVNLSTTERTW